MSITNPASLLTNILLQAMIFQGLKETKESSVGSIVEKYLEDTRYYHDVNHILGMLYNDSLFGPDEYDDYPSVFWAIIFHDVIYDPKSQTNEEDSAEFATTWLRSAGATRQLADRVGQLIRYTKHDALVPDNDEDAKMLCDCDLFSLSADFDVFQENRGAIRLEYPHLTAEEFYDGNKQFLHRLAQRGIFQTNEFKHSSLEARAQENILNT